ncbi:hypothetical protein N658DRAFT_493040 [Parathielavia hyrcaniae]|uniref:Uncharacterized protein n=1 Tax=Parathielavia hyrcaniae TaxID=113614 RepID=A0AAN6Q788_9PEZI|nr:hypothetical protein N658DRAFT_493040 [Parathielavia hyrcaniae]
MHSRLGVPRIASHIPALHSRDREPCSQAGLGGGLGGGSGESSREFRAMLLYPDSVPCVV